MLKRIINSADSKKGNTHGKTSCRDFCSFVFVNVSSGRFKVICYLFFFLCNTQAKIHLKHLLISLSMGSVHASYLKSVLMPSSNNCDLHKVKVKGANVRRSSETAELQKLQHTSYSAIPSKSHNPQ